MLTDINHSTGGNLFTSTEIHNDVVHLMNARKSHVLPDIGPI